MNKFSYIIDECSVSSIKTYEGFDYCMKCGSLKDCRFVCFRVVVNLLIDQNGELVLDKYKELSFTVCKYCYNSINKEGKGGI